YSITPSARSRNDSGMASPSALAVVRLITKSHLVGCSTGNSAAFVPRRILSTNVGLLQFDERWRVSSVGNDRKPTKTRPDFAQQLDALARKLVLLHGNTRDVAAGTVEARDKAGANRVGHQAHDRNRRGHLLCSERHIGCRSSDEIDLHPDEFGDNLG